MKRAVRSNWQGAPCPACGGSLAYHSEAPEAAARKVRVVLVCPEGHCWQELLNLRDHHSSVFVERRLDLE